MPMRASGGGNHADSAGAVDAAWALVKRHTDCRAPSDLVMVGVESPESA